MGMFERLDAPIEIECCTKCGALIDVSQRMTHSLWHDDVHEIEVRLSQTIAWVKDLLVKLHKVLKP